MQTTASPLTVVVRTATANDVDAIVRRRQLVGAFLIWCRQVGAQRIRVVASSKNVRAIAFYVREGFVEYDTVLERTV